jgi:nicotinamidase-related amidase
MSGKGEHYSLLEADDCVLVVIDVQDAFLSRLPPQDSEWLLNTVCWLIVVAQWIEIPLVVTAEEMCKQPLAAGLAGRLAGDTPVFNKLSFDLTQEPDILAAIRQTGRKTAILVGLETDVCVMQSAIGLLELGYRVAVVADVTNTGSPGQEVSWSRMQGAGVIMVNAKGLFYEWLRDVETVNRFHRELPDMRGLSGGIL